MIVLDPVVSQIRNFSLAYCPTCIPTDYDTFMYALWGWKTGLVLIALGVFSIIVTQREHLGVSH